MKKKKIVSVILIICMVIGILAGCSNNNESSESSVNSESEGSSVNNESVAEGTLQSRIDTNDEYIAVCCLNNLEYFNAHKYGWEQTGRLFGVGTSWVGPTDDDVSAMVSALDSAIAKKPAGITVWGYDPALEASINNAIAQGINVVTFIGDVVSSDRLSYIGSSQYDLGYEGGKLYAESIGGEGKIAIMTLPGNTMFEERQAGFEAAFSEYTGIEVVAYGDTKADTITAVGAATDIINSNADLTGFVCTDSTGAAGASTAVMEANKIGDIQVLGMDRNSDILNQIKEGTITASIVQNDVSMSYWALVSLITAKYAVNDIPLTGDDTATGVKILPNSLYTSVNLVTSETADYYLEANDIYGTNGF